MGAHGVPGAHRVRGTVGVGAGFAAAEGDGGWREDPMAAQALTAAPMAARATILRIIRRGAPIVIVKGPSQKTSAFAKLKRTAPAAFFRELKSNASVAHRRPRSALLGLGTS